MDNRTKIDSLHDLMPKHLGTKTNTNWRALIEAIGQVDQDTADLIAEVRKQFFVKTASRPYIDRLAANSKVSRPKLVGMDDASFRQYIPILSYRPKQVKLIIDQLLDVFFFKESTTAFITSSKFENFYLEDGWELEYVVDEHFQERIEFFQEDFTNMAEAKANEIVSAINRQAKHSYATAEYDNVTKNTHIRIFTNTVGSKGSLRITGGRANVAFKYDGFLDTAGNGNNTQWTVTKVGDDTIFQYTGGLSPGLSYVRIGDLMLINMPGNVGSFEIIDVNLATASIKFKNLFSTVGIFTQSSEDDVKFLRPQKFIAYLNSRRAMTWETSPGEITVEMPTSPPVVKRSLKGSIHINGAFGRMLSRDSNTSLTVSDASYFPESGTFFLQEEEEMKHLYDTLLENTTMSKTNHTRLISGLKKYSYTSRLALATTGDTLIGSTQITNLTSVIGIQPGQQIVMSGIPAYATVLNVVGNLVNIDREATVTATGASVKFLGNQLTGITPSLPALAIMNQYSHLSISRVSNIVTVTTILNHNFNVGDPVIISGCGGIPSLTTTGDKTSGSNQITNLASTSGLAPGMMVSGSGIPSGSKIVSLGVSSVIINQNCTSTSIGSAVSFSENLNGGFVIESKTSNTFTYRLVGMNGAALTFGTSRVERPGLSSSNSIIYVTDAVKSNDTRVKGPYMWDLSAPFVLSSKRGQTTQSIQAGKIVRLLEIGQNDLPAEGGYLVFDYGLTTQEGPIRYLYKPSDTIIALDSSYTFQNNHSIGANVNLINHKGPHKMSPNALEYPAYVTDPSQARLVLEDLIRSVKSAGIFVNFLVRYPDLYYGVLDLYNSGVDPG